MYTNLKTHAFFFTFQSGTYGGHHNNMILSGVKCKGSEHNVADCMHDRVGRVFCPGEENIAGVVCSASKFLL